MSMFDNFYSFNYRKLTALGGACLGLALVGCGGNQSNFTPAPEAQRSYEVTVTNNTLGQPLSPAAIILHDPQWASFTVGAAASVAVERLAESGDTTELGAVVAAKHSTYRFETGADIIAPGQSETVTIQTAQNGNLSLSALTMLVNTNDAFAALNGVAVDDITLGETLTLTANTYDAGTEANSESSDTIPGPASLGAGEGYHPDRDDVLSIVHPHPGVVTQADGLSTSALQENHRWGKPAITVQITRTE